MKLFSWILIVCGLMVGSVHGQIAGALDTSFAQVGYRIDQLPDEAFAYAIEAMPDGRIVIGGKTSDSLTVGFAVFRYLPNGDLDQNFAGTGYKFVGGPSIVNEFVSMDLQTDGKILLSAASIVSGMPRIFIQRLLQNGALDTTFANQGTFTQGDRTSNYYGKRVFARFDGKIYFAGDIVMGPAIRFGVGRLNADGSIDNSYGFAGLAVAQPTNQLYWMNDAAFFADGSAILIGTTDSVGTNRTCVLRLDATGTPDSNFGNNGFQYLPTTAFASVATIVEIDPAGGYFLAGSKTQNVVNPSVAVCRLLSNGQLDPSYGQFGFVTLTDPTGVFFANDLIVDATGKLVVVGTRTDIQGDMMAARLDATGQLDPSFGAGGIRTYPLANSDTRATCVAMQPDGKLLLGGGISQFGGPFDFIAARVNGDPPVGLGLGLEEHSVMVFPNPNTGSFQLRWYQDQADAVKCMFYNLQGQELLTGHDWGLFEVGTHEMTLRLQDLPTGIYLLRLQVGDAAYSHRVVIR